MRLLLVQYSGDYRAAYRRQQETGTETYFGHRYVLEQLGRIAQTEGKTAVLCGHADDEYEERLPTGLTVMGTAFDPARQTGRLTPLLERFDPTHLVVLGPLPGIIRWGVRTNRRVCCLFADSFAIGPVRRMVRYGRLVRLLQDSRIEWVANHGVNACLSLMRLGVNADKIIPWDWPYSDQPKDATPKPLDSPETRRLLFVGSLVRSKGIGDAVAALALLRKRGHKIALDVVGGGDIAAVTARAKQLGVLDDTTVHGILSNRVVVEMMHRAFAVLVPSWHAYPEGLPLTIYEALTARTPIIASDHPMFRYNLEHRKTAMIFRAGNAVDLANQVQHLMLDSSLYSMLSAQSQRTWENIQIETKWGDLLQHWVADKMDDHTWLRSRRLSADRFHTIVRDRSAEM